LALARVFIGTIKSNSFVGWVERSDTHRLHWAARIDGYRCAQLILRSECLAFALAFAVAFDFGPPFQGLGGDVQQDQRAARRTWLISDRGGAPNRRLYSRLNCEGLS
jgi:hypothetical protein